MYLYICILKNCVRVHSWPCIISCPFSNIFILFWRELDQAWWYSLLLAMCIGLWNRTVPGFRTWVSCMQWKCLTPRTSPKPLVKFSREEFTQSCIL